MNPCVMLLESSNSNCLDFVLCLFLTYDMHIWLVIIFLERENTVTTVMKKFIILQNEYLPICIAKSNSKCVAKYNIFISIL